MCAFWKNQLRNVSWRRIFWTRNRWSLSSGPYLQEFHADQRQHAWFFLPNWTLILRNLEKDRSPVQLETMRHKYMRRAVSVFGKAECSAFSTINKYIRHSIYFPALWSRLAFCWSKLALRAANCKVVSFQPGVGNLRPFSSYSKMALWIWKNSEIKFAFDNYY